MTTIWMDPVEMKSTAATIAEQAMRIQETMTGTRTTCDCEVPRSLIGWLDAELVAITEDALRVAVLYLQQVIDLATRANQLQADQSLAAAQSGSGLYPTTMTIGGPSPFGVVASEWLAPMTMTIGGNPFNEGVANGSIIPTTMTIGPFHDPILDAARNLEKTNPEAANRLLGLSSFLNKSNSDMVGVWTNSRPGAAYIGDGLYRGDNGITGTISNVYRNKKTGDYEVVS